MSKRFKTVVLECLFDLGITIVYAVLVGILIVAIVASDKGAMTVGHVIVYALLPPGAVLALIMSEMGLRLFQEWRTPSLPPLRTEMRPVIRRSQPD